MIKERKEERKVENEREKKREGERSEREKKREGESGGAMTYIRKGIPCRFVMKKNPHKL